MKRPFAYMAGTGRGVPQQVMTNFDFAKIGIETTDEWIVERTGIKQRHIATTETTTDLAAAAARHAMEKAGVHPGELDIIVLGTASPDRLLPSAAVDLQAALGASRAAAFDVGAACSGFIYATTVAEAMMATGGAETALVIGVEKLSAITDWKDRSTCVLFGDGAGAAVVRPATKGGGFRSWCLGSDGRGYAQVTCGNIEKGAYAAKDPTPYIEMVGPDVFKFAVDIFIRQATEVCNAAGVDLDEIDLWVPHQANYRIIDAAARRIGLPIERVAVNIDEYGNTSSASIPLALEEAVRKGRVKSGDHVLLAGFGSGLTWGATLLKWA